MKLFEFLFFPEDVFPVFPGGIYIPPSEIQIRKYTSTSDVFPLLLEILRNTGNTNSKMEVLNDY
jgi:hypothetical protein